MTEEDVQQYSKRPTGATTCVIGSGFSGLAAARALRTRGLRFTMIERAVDVGGVWRLPSEDEPGPAYRSLHLNTSRKVTSFTGYPMPDDYPRYPRHDQVQRYLERYVNHYDLRESIEFGTEAVSARRRADGFWEVSTLHAASGRRQRRRFRNLVVATGCHWTPQWPAALPGAEQFPGRQLHSFSYRDAAEFAGKRVLVIGLGNSACDIAVELSRIAEHTFLSIRRGAHVVPKQLLGIPIDEIASRRWWARMPFRVQRAFIETLLRVIRGRITDYGIPEPDHRLFSAPITISDELLSRISHGDICVRPLPASFDGGDVVFADDSRERVDAVVYCTGYQLTFPFLPGKYVFSSTGQVALYQRMVAPHHPGLYFLGLLRPVGALTRLVESQAEWVADLVQGVSELPTPELMHEEVDDHLSRASARYGAKAADSIHVDFAGYLRALSRERAHGKRRRAKPGR